MTPETPSWVRAERRVPGTHFIPSMWIRLTNTDSNGEPVTESLAVEGFEHEVEFEDGPVKQVTDDLGKQLVESDLPVVEHDADSDSNGDDSTDEGEN